MADGSGVKTEGSPDGKHCRVLLTVESDLRGAN